jgi:hypothetical protein
VVRRSAYNAERIIRGPSSRKVNRYRGDEPPVVLSPRAVTHVAEGEFWARLELGNGQLLRRQAGGDQDGGRRTAAS